MSSDITDNSAAVLTAIDRAKARALEIIGGKVESYAKGLAPVDTGALRNNITHTVEGDTAVVGSAIHYAPYVELGTGREYSPPPDYMTNNAERGHGIGNRSQKPKPYLRPAVENHTGEYKRIMENELENAR